MNYNAKPNDVQVADMFLYAEQEGVFTKQFMDDLYNGLWKIKRAVDPVVTNADFVKHASNIVARLGEKRSRATERRDEGEED